MSATFRLPVKGQSFWVNLLFSGIIFGILYLQYDPKLYYLQTQPFFAWDGSYMDYMQQFRSGLLSILSQFLLQFLYFPLGGTFLLTLVFLSVALLLKSAFRPLIMAGFEGVQWILPLVLLSFLKSCGSGIEVMLAILLPLMLWWGSDYLRKSAGIKILYDLLSLALLFTITGLLPALFYLALLVPSEGPSLRKLQAWIPLAGGLVFLLGLVFILHDLRWLNQQWGQYSFLFSPVAFPGAWMFLSIIVFLKHSGAYIPTLWQNTHAFFLARTGNWYFPFFILLFLVLFFKPLYCFEGKYRLQIDYFASQHDWSKLLALKDQLSKQDRISRIQLNRALANSGRLSENLFSVSQDWGEFGLFLTKEYDAECLTYSSDQFFDLGYVKASQYWMIEAQTKNPYRPEVLNRLAVTSFLLGENTIAKKYFSILQKSPVYHKYATRSLDLLQRNPDALKKEQSPSNLTILQEFAVLNLKDPDSEMILILRSNRNNRMAFEYLMAYYLLCGNLTDFYHFVPLVLSSGYYKSIPGTYEEALLMCYHKFGIPEDSWPFSIRKELLERYRLFEEKTSEADHSAARNETIRKEFGQTYWYYMKFEQPVLEGKRLKYKVQ